MNPRDLVLEYTHQARSTRTQSSIPSISETLGRVKLEAVAKGDQRQAKEVWYLEQVLIVYEEYMNAFRQMKGGKYYDGWCTLERIELAFRFLDPHFEDSDGLYGLEFVRTMTERYQSLFPYKLFMSVEFFELNKECTICGRPVSLRNPCGHKVGEIYNGEMCGRKVTKLDVPGIALVENPANKYAVPFLGNSDAGSKDHYNYKMVEYVVTRVESAFHGWDVRWTKTRHPHSYFSHLGPDEPCPCESGKSYRKCCLKKSGVLRPHAVITFDVPPPPEMLNIEYSY